MGREKPFLWKLIWKMKHLDQSLLTWFCHCQKIFFLSWRTKSEWKYLKGVLDSPFPQILLPLDLRPISDDLGQNIIPDFYLDFEM